MSYETVVSDFIDILINTIRFADVPTVLTLPNAEFETSERIQRVLYERIKNCYRHTVQLPGETEMEEYMVPYDEMI